MPFSIDSRGLFATFAAQVGDGMSVTVGLLDMVDGAIIGTGATIAAQIAGVAMAVDYSTDGLFVCTLTGAQTTSIGPGDWSWTFRLTPADGEPQTYVNGRAKFTNSPGGGGSLGVDHGIVNSVLVAVY